MFWRSGSPHSNVFRTVVLITLEPDLQYQNYPQLALTLIKFLKSKHALVEAYFKGSLAFEPRLKNHLNKFGSRPGLVLI